MAAIGRKTDNWGSRFGFIMAAVGSSVGLGNFWRFPYQAGENGGAAFIIIYIACVILFGLPVLMAEYGLGRKSGMSAVDGIHSLARAENKSGLWSGVGWLGSLAAFFILTFYMVISAWILYYVPQAFSGAFSNFASDAATLNANIGAATDSVKASISSVDLAQCGFASGGVVADQAYSAADISGCQFGANISNRGVMLGCLLAFLAVNAIILGRGVKGGIERAASILMPAFFLLLLGILFFALTQGDAARTAEFLLTPDFSKVDFKVILAAVGQAFFSIGVGSCLMITYGAYLSQDTDIPQSSMIVAGADTIVALIAGFAIFPIVFAFGADPAAGPGLFFVSLPIAFGAESMPMGTLVGGAFFTLALFAALTSSISLMEVAVSWLEDREGVTRWGASIGTAFMLFMIGAGYIYSADFIDFADLITGKIMLPLCGLLVAVFSGWVLSRRMLTSEFGEGRVMDLWRFTSRWIVPPAIGIILLFGAPEAFRGIFG